jgi:class 3 adenylate cyclase
VAFLFTDIEGSTKLVQQFGSEWPALLEQHRAALRAAFAEHAGWEHGTEGDSFFVVFASAGDAVAAAVDAQRALASADWPPEGRIRVRMGVHTGEGRLSGRDYVGLDVHRAARIAAAAHGGQVVLSEAAATLVRDALPRGVQLIDLGSHRLKDLPGPNVSGSWRSTACRRPFHRSGASRVRPRTCRSRCRASSDARRRSRRSGRSSVRPAS